MEFREDRRKKAFRENLEKICSHNEAYKEGKYSFKLSTNNLADLSNQQYLRHYVRLVNSVIDLNDDQNYILGNTEFENREYPASLDWRLKGFITRPKNQKSCGSCYGELIYFNLKKIIKHWSINDLAFSITHSVEGQLFKRLNRIIELSPQQIVDCSSSYGNHGCAGGSLRTTLKYLEASGGLMREVDYPYTATVSLKLITIHKLFIF